MKNLVLCVTLNLLFFINTVYSAVTIAPTRQKVFKPGTSFTVECHVTSTDLSSTPTIKWSKNGKDITTGSEKYAASWNNNKTVNTLTVSKTEDHDAGTYNCDINAGTAKAANDTTEVYRQVAVDVPNNMNVVEEERLRIECKAIGNGSLHWIFRNQTYYNSSDRVKLENFTYNGITYENGVFIVEKVEMDDRGLVTCESTHVFNGTASASCMVRVKDKYAALWPFLGICAEVIILCAIIVIYEKKRNKTELEESDTDQSPDQKHTPDQGKDSNLRHRQ